MQIIMLQLLGKFDQPLTSFPEFFGHTAVLGVRF